jgi:2-haloacid dehalogenase
MITARLRHGITVNAVAPTFIRTPGTEAALADPVFEAEVKERTWPAVSCSSPRRRRRSSPAPRSSSTAAGRRAEVQPHRAIEAVVFDLGGVLIDWDPRHLYRRMLDGNEAAVERFLAEICTPEWNVGQDAGRPWPEAIETLAREHPAERELIEAFRTRWLEMLGDPLDEAVAIVAELRAAGLPLYALSNWSADTFALARPLYPFLEWFEGIVISGDLGIVKPDPRIYEHLFARYTLTAAATLFVDDSAANVAGAAVLGIVAHQFHDAARLRVELVELGVLPALPD